MRQGVFRAVIILLSGLAVLPAQARITRVVVEDTKSPAFDGRAFGKTGPYEVLSGHVFGELDPKDPHNAIITDIALAPRNAHGMVEYSATFSLIKPVDMTKSSGVLTYQVPNRGGVLFGTPDDSGNVILTSGWQGDIPPRAGLQTIAVPVARNADGSSVTGIAIATLANMPAGQHSLPLTGGIGMGTPRPEPASLDTATAHLTKRTQDGQPIAIVGGYIPFAKTKAERMASGDPQLSLEERYGIHDAYVARVRATAEKLVSERLLLPDDRDRIVKQAGEGDVLKP